MEKVNFIFKGKSTKVDLIFLESVINTQNDNTYVNTPNFEDNKLCDYSKFKQLFNNENELFVVSRTKYLGFFVNLKSDFDAYIDIYKNSNETIFLITSFFESFQLEITQNEAKKRFEALFSISKEFIEKYKFDEFCCKLYEDDEDYYFNHKGYGNLYNQLKEESLNII